MEGKVLIQELNKKIKDIYLKEQLFPLRGERDSYKLNDKNIITWYHEIVNNSSQLDSKFDKLKSIDDLLFISDELIYFTAHLFLYKPYISSPVKDSFNVNGQDVYPYFPNIENERYNMFLGICFEKTYNYWDRIGDLIAAFFPSIFNNPTKIFFSSTIKKLKKDYIQNENFQWLADFLDNEFEELNKNRINIVHYSSLSTDNKWKQLGQVTDYESSKKTHNEMLLYTDFFKEMNSLNKIGFEKALLFLEEINSKDSIN